MTNDDEEGSRGNYGLPVQEDDSFEQYRGRWVTVSYLSNAAPEVGLLCEIRGGCEGVLKPYVNTIWDDDGMPVKKIIDVDDEPGTLVPLIHGTTIITPSPRKSVENWCKHITRKAEEDEKTRKEANQEKAQ